MAIYVDVSATVHSRAGLGRYAESLAHALARQASGRFALFHNRAAGPWALTSLASLPRRSVPLGYKPWRMAVWLGQLAGVGFDWLLPDGELYHATEHLLMPLRSVPTVLTVHDLIFKLFPQHHKRLNYWFLNAAMPLFVRRADAIITISESSKRDLIQHYGTPAEKIAVVYEAAAPRFQPASAYTVAQVRREYDLPDRFLLTVGTIEPRKNLSRLLEALVRLRQDDPHLHLVVVGKRGWLYQDFFRRIETLEMQDVVHFPGYVLDADLSAIYSAAMAVVMASVYEGFGLPVLEALACGTPVVSSHVSSLPEIGGDAACYFDPMNVDDMTATLGQVLADEEMRAEMREAGLEQAAKFSWARAARETMAVYEQVLTR
ncbi:MAG: glycosyltransferase family 4 protein [Anaerolineae bacterium]